MNEMAHNADGAGVTPSVPSDGVVTAPVETLRELGEVVIQGETLQFGAHADDKRCFAYAGPSGALVNFADEVIGTYRVVRRYPGTYKIIGTINGRDYIGTCRLTDKAVFCGDITSQTKETNEDE